MIHQNEQFSAPHCHNQHLQPGISLNMEQIPICLVLPFSFSQFMNEWLSFSFAWFSGTGLLDSAHGFVMVQDLSQPDKDQQLSLLRCWVNEEAYSPRQSWKPFPGQEESSITYTCIYIMLKTICRQEDGKIYKIKTNVNCSAMRIIFLFLNIYKNSIILLIQYSYTKPTNIT